MNENLLAKLTAAKSDTERTWIITENLLNSLPPDLASLAWAGAIPHWFTPEILAALRPELQPQITELYEELIKLSFVEEFPDRGYNIHELTRKLMLEHFWREKREEFITLSKKAAEYFANREQPEQQIERIYHLLVVDTEWQNSELFNLAQDWTNDFRRSELESLFQHLWEQVLANRVSTPALAEIYLLSGDFKFRFYQSAAALQDYEQALSLYRDVGSRLGEAYTLRAIGDVLQFQKQNNQALENYQQALSLYRDVGSRLGEANTLRAIGDVLQFQKQNNQALENYQQALSLFRDVGDRLGEANTLTAIGDVLQFQDQNNQALENYQQALSLFRDVGDRLGEANTLTAIGDVLQFQKQNNQALENYQQALSLYRDVGSRLGEANTLKAIGDVLQFQKQNNQALENYQQALSLFRDVGSRLGEANTLRAIGDVLQFQKQNNQALENYRQALSLFCDVGDRLGEANTLTAIGKLQDEPEKALEYLHQAQNLYSQIGDIYSQSRNLLFFIADVQLQLGQQEAAIASLNQAAELAAAINYEPFQEYAKNKIAEIKNNENGEL
jgi:tetratricopeptide (TPR) repeat protein